MLSAILDCIVPHWMKRYLDPNTDPLDMSQATTAPGRRSSIYGADYGRRSSMFDAVPPWQAAAEDPLNLSGHSTVPGRRSSVYEPIPDLLSPARRRSLVLEPDVQARRRSSIAPIQDVPEIIQMDQAQDRTQDRRREYYTGGDDLPRHQIRTLPKHIKELQALAGGVNASKSTQHTPAQEVKRSWPEPPSKGERRIVSSNYSAVEIHGFFGLIDDGSAGEGRMLIVHVPKWIRGYFLDIQQGDTLHVYHAKGRKVGGVLTVLATGRHRYYAPGRRVTTCTVCVPEEQWAPFSQL